MTIVAVGHDVVVSPDQAHGAFRSSCSCGWTASTVYADLPGSPEAAVALAAAGVDSHLGSLRFPPLPEKGSRPSS